MDTVTLNRCMNCHLQWADEGEPASCPRCRKIHTAPKAAVVCGIEVEVKAVVLYGYAMGLHDPAVRRGLDSLRLGEMCEHGRISFRICEKCNGRLLTSSSIEK